MERWIRGCLVNCEDYHHGETWRRPGEGLPRISSQGKGQSWEKPPRLGLGLNRRRKRQQ